MSISHPWHEVSAGDDLPSSVNAIIEIPNLPARAREQASSPPPIGDELDSMLYMFRAYR